MNPEAIIYLTIIAVNILTFAYVMIKLKDRKGWIYVFPVFMVFGFIVAFFEIASLFDDDLKD